MGVGKVRNGMFVSLDALEFFFWGGALTGKTLFGRCPHEATSQVPQH